MSLLHVLLEEVVDRCISRRVGVLEVQPMPRLGDDDSFEVLGLEEGSLGLLGDAGESGRGSEAVATAEGNIALASHNNDGAGRQRCGSCGVDIDADSDNDADKRNGAVWGCGSRRA